MCSRSPSQQGHSKTLKPLGHSAWGLPLLSVLSKEARLKCLSIFRGWEKRRGRGLRPILRETVAWRGNQGCWSNSAAGQAVGLGVPSLPRLSLPPCRTQGWGEAVNARTSVPTLGSPRFPCPQGKRPEYSGSRYTPDVWCRVLLLLLLALRRGPHV